MTFPCRSQIPPPRRPSHAHRASWILQVLLSYSSGTAQTQLVMAFGRCRSSAIYKERGMSWVGTWKNQFGSIVEITSEAGGRIEGTFQTALEDSGFFGQT